jgi:uncharacterized protein (DUF433 family)
MPTFSDPHLEIRALPNYTILEAAHYLSISVSTMKSWVVGRDYPSQIGLRRFSALIPPAQKRPTILLSFVNIVEAHVLHAIRHHHHVKLPKVRRALGFVGQRMGVPHPLTNQEFKTDGVDLFIEHLGDMVIASEGGQKAIREAFEAHLSRVHYDEKKVAEKLFLFTRPGHEMSQPRYVVMDPMISFGRPVINGSGVPTSAIYERYLAGDEPEHLAKDYRRDLPEIYEAIRCESRSK